MKIYKTEVAPSGKQRVLFALSDEDIHVLKGILDQALLTFPRHPEPMEEPYKRLRAINKGINEYLAGDRLKTPKRKNKDVQCPNCERKLRGEKALEQHLAKTHGKEKNE